MPHSSRVIWDPEKYINLEYNEKSTAVDLKNTDDAIMKSDKKGIIELFSSDIKKWLDLMKPIKYITNFENSFNFA